MTASVPRPSGSGLFADWTSLESLWNAAKRAARGKRHRPGVARTLLELESVVVRLSGALRDGTWRPGVATQHAIHDPKPRTIAAAPFEDRVVHQALCAAIGPLLDRRLLPCSYACREGFGTHAALRQARLWAARYAFAAHLDVQKYFPSIDHAILVAQLERDIACPQTLAVCGRILTAGLDAIEPSRFYFAGDDLFTAAERTVGLPIGNLTSQHFANRYLAPVDHRAKDRLGIRGYVRYMDDMVLFGGTKEQVTGWARAIEEACARQRLRLHAWEVVPTRVPMQFLGFRMAPREVRVKRATVERAVKRLGRLLRVYGAASDAFRASLRATFAHFEHADSFGLRERILRDLALLYRESEGEPMASVVALAEDKPE